MCLPYLSALSVCLICLPLCLPYMHPRRPLRVRPRQCRHRYLSRRVVITPAVAPCHRVPGRRACMHACMCVCMHVLANRLRLIFANCAQRLWQTLSVRACVRACMHACMHAYIHTHTLPPPRTQVGGGYQVLVARNASAMAARTGLLYVCLILAARTGLLYVCLI